MGKKNYKSNNKRNKRSAGKGSNNKNRVPNYNDSGSYVNKEDNKGTFPRKSAGSYDAITSNDISWYNKSELYPDATRIPFNRLKGQSFPTNFSINKTSATAYDLTAMGIDFVPSMGYASSIKDPVNRAFTMLYQDIVNVTTGALQMQQMDLAMYVVGLSNLASHLGFAKRALEMVQAWSTVNLGLPKAIMKASRLSYDDIMENRLLYRERLKDLIIRFNALSVPDICDTFKRQYGLAHNVYLDEASEYGTAMVFNPVMIYLYDDAGTGKLDADTLSTAFDGDVLNFSRYLDILVNAIERFEQSSNSPIIRGNIMRAYTSDQFIQIELPETMGIIHPVVDLNINRQVHNMMFYPVNIESFGVTQAPDKNSLLCQPTATVSFKANEVPAPGLPMWILDSFDGDTSPEFVMESTRLVSPFGETIDTSAPGDKTITIKAMPEVIQRAVQD